MDKYSVNDLLVIMNNNSVNFLEEYVLRIEKNFNVNMNIHDMHIKQIKVMHNWCIEKYIYKLENFYYMPLYSLQSH